MTEEGKEELKQLLNSAKGEIVIKPINPNSRDMSVDEYSECVKACRKSYRPDLTGIVRHYRPAIKNDNLSSKLFHFIKTELAEYLHEYIPGDPNILTARYGIGKGPTQFGYSLNRLLEKLLEITIANSEEMAVSAFDKCTRETTGFYQRIILLQGVSLELGKKGVIEGTEKQIADGIRLVTLPAFLRDQGLPPYLFDDGHMSTLFRSPPMNFMFKTLLLVDCEVTPLFSKPLAYSNDESNPFKTGIKSTKFPSFDSAKFCQALSLSCNSPVQPVFEWEYINEDEIISMIGEGFVGGAHLIPPFDPKIHVSVSENQIDDALKLYEKLVDIKSNIGSDLQIPINRWIKSKANKNDVDKMIDLGVALESLYLPKNRTDQLSLSLRLRAAWHLGKNKAHRKKLIDEFDAIYTLRSEAVHNGELSPKVKIRKGNKIKQGKSVPTSEFIPRAQKLCRKSIIKILEDREFPDDDYWNDIILGEESL